MATHLMEVDGKTKLEMNESLGIEMKKNKSKALKLKYAEVK
jgi:hypothetical protein